MKYKFSAMVLTIFLFSSCSMNKMIKDETEKLLSGLPAASAKTISKNDLNDLPFPVQKWLVSSGIIDKDEILSVWVKQNAMMQMKPGQEKWHNAIAEQYVATARPAFIWTVRMQMLPLIKIRGRDKYDEGKGEMLIKMNSFIRIVNEKGKKMDEGTLQRYLGEIVWYPSAALSPYIRWEAIDSLSARAIMTYKGVTESGVFHFKENGDFYKFVALRYMGNKADSNKYEWVITAEDYTVYEGIRVPAKMNAVWKLDDGDWMWLKLQIEDLKYNIRQPVSVIRKK